MLYPAELLSPQKRKGAPNYPAHLIFYTKAAFCQTSYLFLLTTAACAAASLAIGILNGEQET